MPLNCDCYSGCWGDHARRGGWHKVEFPLDLLSHPIIQKERYPQNRLTFMILVPDWSTHYEGQKWLNHDPRGGTHVIADGGIYFEFEKDAELARRRMKYLRMELSLLEPVHLYLEAHVTIEPVFDERREQASQLAKAHGFKLAKLLMKKEREATEERSDKDTFMTGHDQDYRTLARRVVGLVTDLHEAGFKVWRYKIENTICDSRNENVFGLTLDKVRGKEVVSA